MRLTKKELGLIPSSYDMVGDILVFSRFPEQLRNKEHVVGRYMLNKHKQIKVVCKKTKKFSGKYRLPKLKIIAGDKRKETVYKENGIRLKLNIEKVYFSPRLATERQRINSLIKKNENVLVMFSGSGVFPVNIARNTKAKSILGVEINPTAHSYAIKNLLLNKTVNVNLIKGDVKRVIPPLKKKFDRILMPLPKGAENYLNTALRVSKKGSIIHFYDFLDENEFDLAKEKIMNACKKSKKRCRILRIVKCGQFAPKVFRICVDFKVFN